MMTSDDVQDGGGRMLPRTHEAPEVPVGRAEDVNPWYAIRVRSNFERSVSNSLKNKGFSEFAPHYRARRRWSDRTRIVEFPLFPGYVFCRFDPKRRLPILQTPGVVCVVSFGLEFISVDEREIEAVQRVISCDGEVRPWPYLRVGQKVRVRGGSLDGVEGLLLDLKNRQRLVVSITILQRSVATEIDRDSVEPIY